MKAIEQVLQRPGARPYVEGGCRRGADSLDRLTPREHEVLALMAKGHSNSALAEHLSISERAVEKHIGSIFTKLDLLARAS